MATTPKVLYRGYIPATNTIFYTTPAATKAIISNIIVCNYSASAKTFTLNLNTVNMNSATTIAAGATIYIDLKQTLNATEYIDGVASASGLSLHISGVEIA